MRLIGLIFKLRNWGVPLANWLPVDRQATGRPLPYGIDITPDGTAWSAIADFPGGHVEGGLPGMGAEAGLEVTFESLVETDSRR